MFTDVLETAFRENSLTRAIGGTSAGDVIASFSLRQSEVLKRSHLCRCEATILTGSQNQESLQMIHEDQDGETMALRFTADRDSQASVWQHVSQRMISHLADTGSAVRFKIGTVTLTLAGFGRVFGDNRNLSRF